MHALERGKEEERKIERSRCNIKVFFFSESLLGGSNNEREAHIFLFPCNCWFSLSLVGVTLLSFPFSKGRDPPFGIFFSFFACMLWQDALKDNHSFLCLKNYFVSVLECLSFFGPAKKRNVKSQDAQIWAKSVGSVMRNWAKILSRSKKKIHCPPRERNLWQLFFMTPWHFSPSFLRAWRISLSEEFCNPTRFSSMKEKCFFADLFSTSDFPFFFSILLRSRCLLFVHSSSFELIFGPATDKKKNFAEDANSELKGTLKFVRFCCAIRLLSDKGNSLEIIHDL